MQNILGWKPPLIITRVMLDEVNMQYVITDQRGSFVAKTYCPTTAMAIQQLPALMVSIDSFMTILKHAHPYISNDEARADIGNLIIKFEEKKRCQH